MEFYLGTHKPLWLGWSAERLFVSRRTIARLKTLPLAAAPWALDSGGFSELQMFGEWRTHPMTYATEVRRWRDRIGNLEWAAIQDWMCEDIVINGGVTPSGLVFKGTGLSVKEHQRLTIHSWHLLRRLAPDIKWLPVLQGQHPDDYLAHVEQYKAAGTDLRDVPLVGVGSVCRRQSLQEGLEILAPLHALGLKLHGFGYKITGLSLGASALLASADSLAWSRGARNKPRMAGCEHAFRKGPKAGTPSPCNNCPRYACAWLEKVRRAIAVGRKRYRPRLFA